MPPPMNAVANNSQRKTKRKIKEVVAETVMPTTTNSFPLQQFSPYISTAHRLDLNSQPLPRRNSLEEGNMNLSAAPFNFKSFTSLLTEDDDDQDDSLQASIREQNDQIDQVIKTLCDQLKRALADMRRRQYHALRSTAEENAAKKITKQKELELNQTMLRNVELEQREARYRKDVMILQMKVKHLEQTMSSMRAALQDAVMRAGRPECVGCSEEEVGESSYVDPDRVEPISLACKVCGKRVATVMMWPCRHVCICKRCDGVTRACPVCHSTKTTSFEVYLP